MSIPLLALGLGLLLLPFEQNGVEEIILRYCKTTTVYVQELMNVTFPQHYPQVEGLQTRLHFSLELHDVDASFIKVDSNNKAILQAGRAAGGREKHVCPVSLPMSCLPRMVDNCRYDSIWSEHTQCTEISRVENRASRLPVEGPFAFLSTEPSCKWPVSVL